jgi:metal-responsive CopG/Arc/MetJ family transcriptional regulator
MPNALDTKPPRRILLNAPEALVERLDVWRGRQPGVPNRSQAIRLLIERALDAESGRKGKRA